MKITNEGYLFKDGVRKSLEVLSGNIAKVKAIGTAGSYGIAQRFCDGDELQTVTLWRDSDLSQATSASDTEIYTAEITGADVISATDVSGDISIYVKIYEEG